MEEITHLAWNNQVQHILATSSTTSYTVIWDLKNKREVMNLSYAGPSGPMVGGYGVTNMTTSLGTGGRRSITAVAWNPDMVGCYLKCFAIVPFFPFPNVTNVIIFKNRKATQIMTASEDDSNPVILIWDLRNAHAPEKVLS